MTYLKINLSVDGKSWSVVPAHEVLWPTPPLIQAECRRLALELAAALKPAYHGVPCWRTVRAECLGQSFEVLNPAAGES